MPKKYRDVINPVISRNAYFSAIDMLLTLLNDERCHIRILAAPQIIKTKEIKPGGNCVPAVNFGATNYVGMIDCHVTAPAVLGEISSQEFQKTICQGTDGTLLNFLHSYKQLSGL